MSEPLLRAQGAFAGWVMAHEAPAATLGLLGDARASAAERLGVYRNAYVARIVSALAEDFPALKHALGAVCFDTLAAAYLHAHPSQHPSLRYAGARLPGFIAEHASPAAVENRVSAPWAADLARLELAITDAFDAADAKLLTRADLTALPPEFWGELALALMPGAQLLALRWPVRALRAAHDAEQPLALEAFAPASERVLVWRREERVLHRALEASEAALLARAQHGVRFGELCALAAQERGEEAGAAFAASVLARWIEDGVLATADR